MAESAKLNQGFLARVVGVAYNLFSELCEPHDEEWYKAGLDASLLQEHQEKIEVTLKQLVRDWAQVGEPERNECYQPLIDEVVDFFAPHQSPPVTRRVSRPSGHPSQPSILVPGAGLCRLPWEFARRGFRTEANEFTYFMILTSLLVLHSKPGQHTIAPFAPQHRSQAQAKDQLRKINIPDVHPQPHRVTMQAGDFLIEYSKPHHRGAWDCVVTCFFLDTASNVFDYIECIERILKTGGLWVNLGPLLYHHAERTQYMGKKHCSINLTYQELKGALPALGFQMIKEKLGCSCRYNNDEKSMDGVQYSAALFSCVKSTTRTSKSMKGTTNSKQTSKRQRGIAAPPSDQIDENLHDGEESLSKKKKAANKKGPLKVHVFP